MKIVIFEGIDKVGKTTAINTLKSKLKDAGMIPVMIGHPFVVDDSLTDDMHIFRLGMTVNNLLEIADRLDDRYVCLVDRLHISQNVYGRLLRKATRGDYMCEYADNKLKYTKSILVHIMPDDIIKNFNKFKDKDELLDGLSLEQYKASYDLFCEFVSASKISNKISTSTSKINNMLDVICGMLTL